VHALDELRVVVLTDGLQDVTETVTTLTSAHDRGARFALLVRAYDAPIDAQCTFSRALRNALPQAIPLIFAGHPSVALRSGADGVHLGRRVASIADGRAIFGSNAWVSVPAHSPSDIADAEREGAYAALVSPVLATPGKGAPLGFSGLACMLRGATPRRIRAFALGGLSASDVGPCLRAQAHGVAVIRSVWTASNPADALVAIADATLAVRASTRGDLENN
jgi:thiamine-phosphate pyrophosphorylase